MKKIRTRLTCYNFGMQLRELGTINQGMATAGKGAGARPGNWSLQVIESGDIAADTVEMNGLRTIRLEQNTWTEKHLLHPYDLLVTARSQTVKVALVPRSVTRTVAASTLLVVRPLEPETGIGPYLWYYLTSKRGRAAVEGHVVFGATIPSLSAIGLGRVEVPLPTARELHHLAHFVEASEEAYSAAIRAAAVQRETLRDAIVGTISENGRPHGADD
jgi:hypothetical protein